MTAYDSAYGADPDTSATVTVAAQGARTVMTGHTLTATLGPAASSVVWSSGTGAFNSSTSLTPTYTPTTIGHQSATCTPSGTAGLGVAVTISWDVSRPLPVAANATAHTVISTLALQTEALSDAASPAADGVTWVTVVQRFTTAGVLEGTETVGGTSTAPTWTPSALDRNYIVTSTATDAYGRTSVKVRSVAAIAADLPTGNIGADTSQSTLALITLDGSAIVGASSFLWSVDVLEPADSTYTSTATPAAPTSQSTTFTPDGVGDIRIKCVATNATGSTTFERQVSQTRPYPAPASSLGLVVYMAAGTYGPTLSDGASADTVTWSTTVTKVSDGSSVSVTNSTTTTPTFTVATGLDYRVRHRATDAYGRVVDYVATVSESSAAPPDLTVSLSTGATVNQASPAGQVITATPSGGTGSKTYAWTAKYHDGTSANALLSATNVSNPTLTTTAYAQRVIATVTATDSGSPAQVAVASVMVVVAGTPIVFSNPSPQTSATAGAASITFSTATGGIGTLTPGTATLAKPAGSSASLSGSGYGAYTFTMDFPGTYAVTQSVTDDFGQTTQATGTVAYAPVGPTWTVLDSEDFTASSTDSRASAGTLTLSSGRALVAYTSGTVSGTWGNTNGSGLYLTQASGTGEMWMYLTPTAAAAGTKVALQVLCGAQTFTGTTDLPVPCRLSDGTDWNTGGTKSLLFFQGKTGNYQLYAAHNVGSTNTNTTIRNNASDMTYSVCYTIIMDGTQSVFYVHTNVSTYVPLDSILSGSPLEYYDVQAVSPPAVYARWMNPTKITFGHMDAAGSTLNIKGFRWLEATRQ